jgi:chemotaxis protein CheX
MLTSELVEIVERLWQTTLALPLTYLPDARPEWPQGAALLTASIHFGGSFPAQLSLTCPRSFACSVAASMFRVQPECASREDVRDAIGEVINIVGGNLKAVASPSCQLSLPHVVDGDVAAGPHGAPAAELLAQLMFESAGERFALRLSRIPA